MKDNKYYHLKHQGAPTLCGLPIFNHSFRWCYVSTYLEGRKDIFIPDMHRILCPKCEEILKLQTLMEL